MNKRLISFMLVLVLICTLLPMVALADGAATGTVKVLVFGKAISNALYDVDDLSQLPDMIKKNIQDSLAGEHMPDCEIVLIDEDGVEYPLSKGSGEFMESLDIKYHSAFSNQDGTLAQLYQAFLSTIDTLVDGIKSKASDGIAETGLSDTMKDYYVTYSNNQIPTGKYMLKVKAINGNGYTLWEPANGKVSDIVVEEGKVTVAGYAKEYSTTTLIQKDDVLKRLYSGVDWALNQLNNGIDSTNKLFHTSIAHIEMPSVTASLSGVWLKRVDPGFEFIKTDLADNPVEGADFLMIDRNETVKVLKAMIALGKDTFTNAMQLIGTEGYTWEELNFLNAGLISTDEETNQIGLDPVAAEKLVTTYWSLVEASAKMPIKDFLKEDLRVPALLKATSNDDGIVNFTEDSNITLVWSINVLMKIAGVSNDWIQNLKTDDLDFDNDELKAIMEVIIPIVQAASAANIKITEDTGELAKGFINDWIYPVLQNDDIPKKLSETLKTLGGEEDEDELTWKDFIPDHAILTSKMPASDYILMEEKAPEGYMRNPFFYTIHLTWNTEKEDVSEWCYVTVADLGIIGPYLAENYYTFFRNNSFVSVADKILNKVIGKEDANVLNWALTTDDSVTAATLSYWAKLLSANAAGDSENGSEEAMANELTNYVIKHGNNAQSLMQFAYQVANRGRAVISSEVNEDWHFYNFNDSIHTSYATKITALLNGAKESLKEENDTLVSSAVKKAIDTQINIIGKVDAAITTATASFTAAVKDATAKVAESVKENVKATAKSVVSSLLKRLFK